MASKSYDELRDELAAAQRASFHHYLIALLRAEREECLILIDQMVY
jgi:hypothetical protein